MTDFVCFPINNQGVAMAISTAAFGVYFYLMSKLNSSTTEEPHTDLAWLALASMAVFITGNTEIAVFLCDLLTCIAKFCF